MDNVTQRELMTLMDSSLCLNRLPEDQKLAVLDASYVKKMNKGGYLHRRGDQPSGYFGVIQGRVRASAISESGKALSLYVFNKGDWFGEISIMDGISRTHDAEVLEDSEFLMIPTNVFETHLLTRSETTRWVAQSICARLRLALQFIEESVTQTLSVRLANRLILMHPNTLNTSQEELAHMLGVSRQSISKLLIQWQVSGWVGIEYGGVQILNMQALKSIGEPVSVPVSADNG